MGLSNSKIEKQICENELREESLPSTPIMPPKSKVNEFDPRSPSAHISRTPLELLSAVSEKLENLGETETALFQNQTPSRIEEKVVFGIDPRSPTIDFTRTPIIISTDTGESNIPEKPHNKNLDKVRQANVHITPKSYAEKPTVYKRTAQVVPPKLLDSSPMKRRLENSNRRSLIGLLETNLDFTETNLDEVIREKCHIEHTPLAKTMITVIDPRSPTIDFERTPIQVVKKQEEDLNVVKMRTETEVEKKVAETDSDSQNYEIESDQEILEQMCEEDNVSEIFQDTENIPEENASILESTAQEAFVETENESRSAPVSPSKMITPDSPILAAKQTKSAPETPPLANITANVKELDKKLTNLIYEDEDIVVCPRIVKLKENVVRSPLRNRNRNEQVKPKLKVSDKPRKSDYAISKIPVFRDKARRGDIQCENTPPRNRDNKKAKAKKSHWDNDNTLYI